MKTTLNSAQLFVVKNQNPEKSNIECLLTFYAGFSGLLNLLKQCEKAVEAKVMNIKRP